MKKDKDLQELFNNYVSDFSPHDEKTIERAKKIALQNKKTKKNKKIIFGGVFASLATCLIFVLTINLFLRYYKFFNPNFSNEEATVSSSNITENEAAHKSQANVSNNSERIEYYYADDLKYKRLTQTEVQNLCDLNALNDINYVEINYYGYFGKQGEAVKENLSFIYIKGGFIDNDCRCDFELIIEFSDKYYYDAKDFIVMPDYSTINGLDIVGFVNVKDGEYYSMNYFKDKGVKYYLQFTSATQNENKKFIQKLI